MTRSEFHWRCPSCGLLNGGWRNYCADPRCGKEYSVPHGNLILTYLDIIKYTVGFATDITTPPDFNQIELPGRIFPAYAPEPWYETTCALKYYNELKNSSTYRLTPSYAEGVEFAWYRTVRILYPKLHDATTVERLFDKFILNDYNPINYSINRLRLAKTGIRKARRSGRRGDPPRTSVEGTGRGAVRDRGE